MEFTNTQQIKGGDVEDLHSHLPLPLSYQKAAGGADGNFRAADKTAASNDKTFNSINADQTSALDNPFGDDDAFEAAAKDITDAAVAVKDGISHIISSTLHKAQDVGHAIREKLGGSRSPSPAPHAAPNQDGAGNGDDEIADWPAPETKKKEATDDTTADTSKADELLLDGEKEAAKLGEDAAAEPKKKEEEGGAELQDWEKGSDLGPAPSTIKDFETKMEQKKEKFEKEWPPLASPEPEQAADAAPAAWELEQQEAQQQSEETMLSPRPMGAWAPENATIGALRHAPAPVAWQNTAKAPMQM